MGVVECSGYCWWLVGVRRVALENNFDRILVTGLMRCVWCLKSKLGYWVTYYNTFYCYFLSEMSYTPM